jgi:hypothetical protein
VQRCEEGWGWLCNVASQAGRIWSVVTLILFLVLMALRKQIWRAATLYMLASDYPPHACQ